MTDIVNKEKILAHAKQLTDEGKFDRAVAEYQKLMALDPSDLRLKIKIAELYVKRKQIQDAIRLYMEVAQGYADGGFYLKAVTVYKSILRLNPSLIDVNLALSELYERMGLVQDALHQYQIVATSMEQKGEDAGMLNIREKMAALNPSDVSLRIRLAESYQLHGDIDKSLDVYEELSKQLKNAGKTAQLIELYSKILVHRPEKHELVREICHLLHKRGEWKEILKRMETSKAFVNEDPELLRMQAEIYARLNQVETAKRTYRLLAEILTEDKDIDGALLAYEDLLFLGPEDETDIMTEVEELKAGAFADVKKHVEEKRKRMEEGEARREAEVLPVKEVKTQPLPTGNAAKIEKDALVSYDLGRMYKQMGLTAEAEKEFGRAMKVFKQLAATGAASVVVLEKIAEFEGGANEQAAKPAPAPKRPRPVKRDRPKKEEEPKPPSSGKKISFV